MSDQLCSRYCSRQIFLLPAPFDRVINRSDPSRGHRCRNKAFDYLDPSTWHGAFAGVELMFLARPAALSNVPRDILPALEAAKRARVKHNVVLSLQCAESNKVVPTQRSRSGFAPPGCCGPFFVPRFLCKIFPQHRARLNADRPDRQHLLRDRRGPWQGTRQNNPIHATGESVVMQCMRGEILRCRGRWSWSPPSAARSLGWAAHPGSRMTSAR